MRVRYDRSADAAYIYLVEIGPGEAADTVPLDELPDDVEAAHSINLDFNKGGELIGIEVLNARRSLPAAVLEQAEQIGPRFPD